MAVSMIPRPDYLDRLEQWRDRDLIKVITGVRRCGKSTVMAMFRDRLLARGVSPDCVHWVNLEDLANAAFLDDPMALHSHIEQALVADQMNYVFIDEIQQMVDFERVAASLNLRPLVDLYVTGSSSKLLSGSLATLLAGRYIEIKMLPLSFHEYVNRRADGASPTGLTDLFMEYLRQGGFPAVPALAGNSDLVIQYLQGIVDTVLLRDVATNRRVANVEALRSVVEFLAGNVGSFSSVKRISDGLGASGRAVSRPAVESYLGGLVDAFLFYPTKRSAVRGKAVLQGPEKYYIVDTGLRYALTGGQGSDIGHLLENVVYLELLRRGGQITVGRLGQREVDFVITRSGRTSYVQVAASVRQPDTLERELTVLRAIPGYGPRLLLTLDPDPPTSHNGIEQRYIPQWLLSRGRGQDQFDETVLG